MLNNNFSSQNHNYISPNLKTKILQWNINGIKNKKQEISSLLSQYKIDIVALQETKVTSEYMYKFNNYNLYTLDGSFNRMQHGGVALYIRNTIPQMKINLQTDFQAVAVTVQLRSKITICSFYNSRSMILNLDKLNNLYNQLPQPCLILGDFNGYNTIWGCNTTDRRGTIIENFTNLNNLIIMNNGAPTHPNPTNDSAIDLSLCHPQISEQFDWNTLPSPLDSDHIPIIISTENPEPDPISFRQIKKANWTIYMNSSAWNNLPSEEMCNERLLEDFYNRINLACEESIPTTTPSKFYPKPFWNPELTSTRQIRENLYQIYRRNKTLENKINWHRARAIHKNKVQTSKENSWREYISEFNDGMPIKEICNRIRKIKGIASQTIRILVDEDDPTKLYSTPFEIAETLAKTFAKVSSNDNYSPQFIPIKNRLESNMPNFGTSNDTYYNKPFTTDDLSNILSKIKNSTPGEDGVHYKMIINLPLTVKHHLIKILNKFFTESYFPPIWSKSIIIPIVKQGKNPNSPQSYRPIALTSCICKLFERLLNERLMEFMIMKNILSPAQSGGQKYRSTIDHLIRLESTIKETFASNEHCISIFFDLERAYDMTWRSGIINDLYQTGMRGLLPKYIVEFLKTRKFKVKVGNTISNEYEQKNGVPQGAVLSVLLFALKMNSVVNCFPQNERFLYSLYVDDLQISFRHPDLNEIKKVLQKALNELQNWSKNNGFKFSAPKTKLIHFNKRKQTIRNLPTLQLNQKTIHYSESARFLGLEFDSTLSWSTHLTKLKSGCQKLLGIMKTLSSQKFGATQTCLMKIYRIFLRSKLDYGSIIYASASDRELNKIDIVTNEALRIASGAFKSSPIDSLYVICDEMKPSERRDLLTIRFFLKLKSSLNNPATKFTTNRNETLLRNTNQKAFNIRSFDIIRKYNLPEMRVKPSFSYILHNCLTPKYAIPNPTRNYKLTKHAKHSTSPTVYKALYQAIINEEYHNFTKIYTDGSKSIHGVGAAIFQLNPTASSLATLPKEASIFSAECYAIQLAVDCIFRKRLNSNQSPNNNYVIFTDSRSVFDSLHNGNDNPTIRYILHKINVIKITQRTKIEICWIPSHIGIAGNERADARAKEATKRSTEWIPIHYKDYYPIIKEKINSYREQAWSQTSNKLKDIKDNLHPWTSHSLKRREEVILNRLRIGHTNLTHKYLMESTIPPICFICNNNVLTVKHLLTQCLLLQDLRNQLFCPPRTLKSILGNDCNTFKVIEFLIKCNIFDHI